MTYKKSLSQNEEFQSSSEPRPSGRDWKSIVIFTLKRVLYYLTILHGVLTVLFLVLLIPFVDLQYYIGYYLTFSLILFVIYGLIIYPIHLLEKSYLQLSEEESIEKTEISPKIRPDIVRELLQGKTLQVYWYIFTHNYAGIREIQKALNFTSSGTVSYQISKLLKEGIISKDESEGKYKINKEIKIGVLKFFVRIGNRMVPRISLYLIVFILGLMVFFLLTLIGGYEFVVNPLNILLLCFLLVGIVIFIIESYKIWKLNPTK